MSLSNERDEEAGVTEADERLAPFTVSRLLASGGTANGGYLTLAVASSAGEPEVTAVGLCWHRAPSPVARAGLSAGGAANLPAVSPVRVFVAMSFREEEEPALVDYWQAMLRAAEQANREFSLMRLDYVAGDYEIVDRIYREIDAADLVIADFTLSSSNVYLELGYARGRGKRVIQTCRDDTRLEFDIRGRRTLRYRNATSLEEKLLRELDALH
jgi:nucleoside 2-deoxyribosyltransferase